MDLSTFIVAVFCLIDDRLKEGVASASAAPLRSFLMRRSSATPLPSCSTTERVTVLYSSPNSSTRNPHIRQRMLPSTWVSM